jgi:hypothetical protein
VKGSVIPFPSKKKSNTFRKHLDTRDTGREHPGNHDEESWSREKNSNPEICIFRFGPKDIVAAYSV